MYDQVVEQRDQLRAEVERLARERDEARGELAETRADVARLRAIKEQMIDALQLALKSAGGVYLPHGWPNKIVTAIRAAEEE
jgi:uncharacterized coiled-coil DUF342 family protein